MNFAIFYVWHGIILRKYALHCATRIEANSRNQRPHTCENTHLFFNKISAMKRFMEKLRANLLRI